MSILFEWWMLFISHWSIGFAKVVPDRLHSLKLRSYYSKIILNISYLNVNNNLCLK